MKKINILGVNISGLDYKDTLEEIKKFLFDGRQHQIVTPNPEFLVAAAKDEEFFYILNRADLAVPDGIGLVLAGLFLKEKIQRITGVDLIYDICRLAEKENKSIYLLGGENNTAETAAAKLKEQFPDLMIAGAEEGLKRGEWQIKDGSWTKGETENKKLLDRINQAKPDIIFAGLGHPRQEKWIFHCLEKIPSARVAIGVGGGLDFVSGRVKRAPVVFRKLFLEWLWRLIIQPWRWRRIVDAVIIFPLKFFHWKFIMPFQYRSNVACLLYKKDGTGYKILLVKRTDLYDHWQTPQGGTDGQSLAEAGTREMNEELGTAKFIIKACFANVYKYKFGERNGDHRKQRPFGYKGQTQGLCIALFTGTDEDIKINHWDHVEWKWVASENFINEVNIVRREVSGLFLDRFHKIIDTLDKNQ